MSPARTTDHGIDLNRLVRQILLDCILLKWFARHGRGLAAVSAIVAARRQGGNGDVPVLDFLERWIGEDGTT